MKKLIVGIIVIVAIAASGGAYYAYRRQAKPPEVSKAAISRGSVVDSVGATGTLEAVTTVQVGSQVSGTVEALYADFNSIVRKGQVIAKLDPSLLQTQIEQARANLIRSEADVERLKVSLEDAKTKLTRAEDLAKRNLIPASDLQTAQVDVKSIDAQIKSSQAQVTQSRANLNQTQVNLKNTIITAPIDGIVISRNVDIGQTVAASFNAPVLFLLAADLTKMQVRANIDEADVGRIRPGQVVRFRVDAYPTEEFEGRVSQVRLQPTVVQNVVTYITVIDVPNPNLKLKPGMTANVTLEIARADNVLRVPNGALRFRATPEMFTALNLPIPPELQRGTRQADGARAAGSAAGSGSPAPGGNAGAQPPAAAGASRGSAPQSPSGAPPAGAQASEGSRAAAGPGGTSVAGGGQGGSGSRGESGQQMDPEQRRQMMERVQNMSPEERQQFFQRMRERQGTTAGGAAPSEPSNRLVPGQKPLAVTGAQTIDSLFGPLPRQQSFARVWLWTNNQLKSVRVRLGIADSSYTELLSSDLPEGTELVTGIVLEQARATTGGPAVGGNPFMGSPRPGMPGGFRDH